jgi:hypothetical protein
MWHYLKAVCGGVCCCTTFSTAPGCRQPVCRRRIAACRRWMCTGYPTHARLPLCLQRYKICPHHLELPCLVVEGQTIRFCQQCGRFQLLTDFEGDRRSCRRKVRLWGA